MGRALGGVGRAIGRLAFGDPGSDREPVLLLAVDRVIQRTRGGDAELRQVLRALGIRKVPRRATADSLTKLYDQIGAGLDRVPDMATYNRYVSVLLTGTEDLGTAPGE